MGDSLSKIIFVLCSACLILVCVVAVSFRVVYLQNEDIFRLKKQLIEAQAYQQADSIIEAAHEQREFDETGSR